MSATDQMSTETSLLPQGFTFEGNQVRVTTREGEPWFVLADVCHVLEIDNRSDAARRLDDDEKGVDTVDTLGGSQKMLLVNESGLYSLILTSRKEAAKRFKKWVTAEVLPAIRKTGSYGVQTVPDLNDPDILRGLLLNYSAEVKALRSTVTEQKPVVDAYDRLSTRTGGTLCITDAAKALQLKPKFLFDWMQRHGWIYRRPGGSSWLGYQSRTQAGHLEHKVTTITVAGEDRIREQVLVTAKGLAHLAKIHAPLPLPAAMEVAQ